MDPTDRELKAIFCEAVDRPAGPERDEYLDGVCPVGMPLRARVDALLRAHDASGRFLGSSPGSDEPADATTGAATPADTGSPEVPATLTATASGDDIVSRPLTEGPGTWIGPYKLVQMIGEGGMGAVFLAEQERPVRRTVALKVIKPGMDTSAVTARFETERQALALMDHPNIAKVLDAGTTHTGHPFFVMEFVQGVPITDYCDTARLTPRQRLELFIPVCQAVQHAHQKGVIHRDMKPSNVLVVEIDGKPVPKVIDFGVAKAIDQRLTERTQLTRLGAIVGTPEYMSPEQAGTSADIDTRSDVYGLGVLLYELLTGTTPLDRETLRQAGFDEVLKRVREEEPPKPSTRLSGTDERLPSVAAVRGTEPVRLARLVRGDLDWVVMKALEKDRARRYETPSAFARDVQRHLDGDPVEAGPPSRSYRLRKFTRKHRAALAMAGAITLVLIAATAVSTWEAWRATRAEKLAETRLSDTKKARAATQVALKRSEEAREQAEEVSHFLVRAFRKPDPEQDGRELKVADLLARAAEELDSPQNPVAPGIKSELLHALGQTFSGLGLPAQALEMHEKARAIRESVLAPDHPDTLISRSLVADGYGAVGRLDEAIALHKETLKIRTAKLGPEDSSTLNSRNNLASAYFNAGRLDEAIAMHEATLKIRDAKFGSDHPDTCASRSNLAQAYLSAQRADEAVPMLAAVLKATEARRGQDHPETLMDRDNLAAAYQAAGRIPEAIAIHEETLEIATAKLGPHHPGTLVNRNNLAVAYALAGRYSDALPLCELVLNQLTAKLGSNHPETLWAEANLGAVYRDTGRPEEGARRMEAAIQRARGRPAVLESMDPVVPDLAETYEVIGRWNQAELLMCDLLARQRNTTSPDSPVLASSLAQFGHILLHRQKYSEAEEAFRECLRIREAKVPDDWSRFNTMSQLGGALVGQGRYAEAEPLVVQGYEGMETRKAKMSAYARARVPEAAERLFRLYEAWGKPEEAKAWKEKLGLADLPTEVFARP
jgi:serine/threonine protein kinase/tetratricopeptide (TPR) repeat protein